MDDYPEELRTPPVSLVALVGCSEIHTTISTYLHKEQPPINTLALPDFSKLSLLAKQKKSTSSDSGILKRDWLLKHRTKVPAVVAVCFSSEQVSGDPKQWLDLTSCIDSTKAILHGRNVKLVIVIVQSTPNDKINEDRIIALWRHAEVDPKYVITFVRDEGSELKQSLSRIGSTFGELANTFYKEEGRKIKTVIERKNISSVDLNVRYCFKVAVYAEFRRDWVEASRFYEDGYLILQAVIGAPTILSSIQRIMEIKCVVEQFHFKISTLLLHGGRLTEALTWFHKHSASYKKLVGPPNVDFLHWEWMSRQFLVFAELLEASTSVVQPMALISTTRPLTEWELLPPYYYQLAAHYLVKKRSTFEHTFSTFEAINDSDDMSESVIPSAYVGKYAHLLDDGDMTQFLSDEDYIRFALVEGKRFPDSYEIIALLRKSFEVYSSLSFQRMASYCAFQIATEYYTLGDFSKAKQFFESVASSYRQEGWVTMLWETLGYLRDCAKQSGLVKDFVEYSFEMAALPTPLPTTVPSLDSKACDIYGKQTLLERENIHKELFKFVGGELNMEVSEGNHLKVSQDDPLHIEIDPVSPMRIVLLASAAFHEQIVKPGTPIRFTLAILSHFPLTVEVDQLNIEFNQSACNFIVMGGKTSSLTSEKQDLKVVSAPALYLVNSKWLRLTYDVIPEHGGKLECISVTAKIGPCLTICCIAESPASMDDLPLRKFENQIEGNPMDDLSLSLAGQKAIQVEEPDPSVDVSLIAKCPALVGEHFPVLITITSKGHEIHSGELKINLVDTRGGGIVSPREADTSSLDNPPVGLVGISEMQNVQNSDIIKKIHTSFGLVSVPLILHGESWCCKLEIQFHQPKFITLYVSLGYSSPTQKINVHKSLQIEGNTALAITHRLMQRYRQDALLPSWVKNAPSHPHLPLNKPCIVVVSATNCTEVSLTLHSMSIVSEDVQCGDENPLGYCLLPPGESFKKAFSVITTVSDTQSVKMGMVHLTWARFGGSEEEMILTKHMLPEAMVEFPPLIASLECPAHAILGDPFTYSIKIQNQTPLLQEVKIALPDSQNFVLSGYHSDTVAVLPKAELVISYRVVALGTGASILPRVVLTATRYTVGFQPSSGAASIFVFPSNWKFEMVGSGIVS